MQACGIASSIIINGACLVAGEEKFLSARTLALTLARGGRRRETLTNREGGAGDEDRVLAASFLLHRDPWRTGATAVRVWGAGKTFFAPRPPSSAQFCARSPCIALSSLSGYTAHSSLHHHSFTWQVAIIVLAKLRALVGVQNQRGRRSSFENVFCGTLRRSAA